MLKRILISATALGLLFILLGRVIGLSEGRLEYATSIVLYPFLRFQQAIVHPIKKWRYRRRVKRDLLTAYEQVVRERNELQKELIILKGQRYHEAVTDDLRAYGKRFSDNPIVAPVLLKSVGTYRQFLLVDAGSQAGVKVDMIASSNNCLVGKVTEVYPYYSKILVITDTESKVAAFCVDTGTQGILSGQRNGLITLEYVDHRDIITEGDTVLSSGLGGLFPRGFSLGTVTEVHTTQYGRSIVVAPCCSVEELDYVTLMPHTITLKS